MEISEYLKEIQKTYVDGGTKEHSFRSSLETYLKNFFGKTISVIQEPEKEGSEAPDFAISKAHISIGKIETKTIGVDLKKLENSDQLIRYKKRFKNLIFTNYLEFIHYKKGKERDSVKIAEFKNDKILPLKKNFNTLVELLEDFCGYEGKFIGTPQKLAKIMAKKAKFMATAFQISLNKKEASKIKGHFEFFKENLTYDITQDRFASIYAETITYGLFIAHIYSKKEQFSTDKSQKREAFSIDISYKFIPKSFPFLKDLFTDIVPRLDEDIKNEADELREFFKNTNIKNILEGLGSLKKKDKGKTDTIVYFYEDFLKQYNPKIRKARGIYYTPEAVVNFIVRAIDTVLKNHFNLPDGIADKSKVIIPIKEGQKETSKEVHKVQLLDVATGTGSFLIEVIRQIHETFQRQTGNWSSYVEEHLLPRLHGFEILMAAYAMCHLKIGLCLQETGYNQTSIDKKEPQRLRVYLSNALEKAKDTGTLTDLLTQEAKAANQVKRETPVMVAFGNPPYSKSSQNKGEWIQNLIQVYKKNLKERKINIDDDYIKFIRLAEHYISKNEEGIVAMVTNNSFLDGITHRQMRKHLLETFDCIYIYNLHGDIERDGSKDKNVFDIMQGVAIFIFVKNNKKTKDKLADVFYLDSYGNREEKYKRLWEVDLEQKHFKKLTYKEPYCFFVPKAFKAETEYKKGFKIIELMPVYNSGIKTDRDSLFIGKNKDELSKRIKKLLSNDYNNTFIEKYRVKNSSGYKLIKSIVDRKFEENFIKTIQYRVFDYQNIYYDPKIISRPGYQAMQHILAGNNLGLIFERIVPAKKPYFSDIFITQTIQDIHTIGSNSYIAPLYLYLYNGNNSIDKEKRNANLNPKIVREIEKKLGLKFVADHEFPEAQKSGNFSPLDLLDYIYAVLHSPSYREKYQEFLKIDFPRVPYPEDKEKFKKLVKLGSQMRETHLLQGKNFGGRQNFITNYDIQGNNLVEKIYFDLAENSSELGRVYINKTQYFGKVPKVAWDFFIGGYQPAQKWLKDRKDRLLSNDEIEQYQKIILALKTTSDIMPQIDPILFS